jgi:hypothetical protein
MRGLRVVITTAVVLVVAAAPPALACGGLVAPNGSVQLVRTTTLAAYHRGVEHYVTSFRFAGEGEFGSIVPLPGVPTKVIRGGDWTLQRLALETQPRPEVEFLAQGAAAPAADARVLLETEVDALDIVVLEGGAIAVGEWARDHGFLLPPDAPEVLEFYAKRSPIFMVVRYDGERAAEQGLAVGDGTPVHVVIPTPNPWVPLRILALGAPAEAPVEVDVYLLTDREPATLPVPVSADAAAALGERIRPGLVLEASDPASRTLLADLRSDRGMRWLPADGMWLTYLRVDARAGDLTYDLAVDASGAGRPAPLAAGLDPTAAGPDGIGLALWAGVALVALFVLAGALERRRAARPAF